MYRYRVDAFRSDRTKVVREEEISGVQLYHHTGRVGHTAFLELVNSWNRNGLRGVPNGGPIYVYTAL